MKVINKFTVLAVATVAMLVYFLVPPPPKAKADISGPIYSDNSAGATFRLDGSAATNVAYVIDCKNQQNVALAMYSSGVGAATQAVQVAYSLSLDGLYYESRYSLIGLASWPYTTNIFTTNINTVGFGYLKIQYVTNGSAAGLFLTNTIKWANKISSP